MKNSTGRILFWIGMILGIGFIWIQASNINRSILKIEISYFNKMVEMGNIKKLNIYYNGNISGELKEATNRSIAFELDLPPLSVSDYMSLQGRVESKNPSVSMQYIPNNPGYSSLLYSWGPIILMIGFWIFFMRQLKGGDKRSFSFGKSRAKLFSKSDKKITFKNVAGVEEAKEELHEIIEFLREPLKFQKLGGRIPKGVLLTGPPGTGKTLLARAVAGEADVPFFSISGSDFVEMFVGVGASRVRDLFEQGKKNAPCILFIDEIDAVGRHRGAGLGGGHDEREQTLNQLLVEMDGFESNEGVILVAATNRPDVLDPALLRPGRFDRRVVVNRPDVKGRREILNIHARKVPLADNIDLGVIARGTSGFSGADLANLVNEAALNAARLNQDVINLKDLEFAKDKVLMGAERKSMVLSDAEKKVTAIHEAGHALLAVILPNADPIHKVTIIPRGMAMGLTVQLPIDDHHNYSREYLEDMLAILLGGRIAEELVTHQLTTGAGNDLERATDLARRMVCEWGMSNAMGPMTFGKKEREVFLGRDISEKSDFSEATAVRIDQEIKMFISQNYERAKKIIIDKLNILNEISRELLIREVLDADQIDKIMNGIPLDTVATNP